MIILLIDDNPGEAALFNYLFPDWAGEMTVKCIGRETWKEGREALASETVDVVLLDVGLPDAEFPKPLQWIKESYPAIPVFMYSGSDSDDMREESMRHGAQGFFLKGTDDAEKIFRTVVAGRNKT